MAKKIEINLVDHLNVGVVMELLTKELTRASDTGNGSYRELENARNHLERGRGMYTALSYLELLQDDYITTIAEDLSRIEQKITTTQRAKEAEAYARHIQRRSYL